MGKSISQEIIVEHVGETQEFGSNGFRKRELVGHYMDNEFKNYLALDFVQDKVGLLDKVEVGQTVTVHFNIRCRKVEKFGEEDRYYTSLGGWKIE